MVCKLVPVGNPQAEAVHANQLEDGSWEVYLISEHESRRGRPVLQARPKNFAAVLHLFAEHVAGYPDSQLWEGELT